MKIPRLLYVGSSGEKKDSFWLLRWVGFRRIKKDGSEFYRAVAPGGLFLAERERMTDVRRRGEVLFTVWEGRRPFIHAQHEPSFWKQVFGWAAAGLNRFWKEG